MEPARRSLQADMRAKNLSRHPPHRTQALLDESTSALDLENEALVYRRVRVEGRPNQECGFQRTAALTSGLPRYLQSRAGCSKRRARLSSASGTGSRLLTSTRASSCWVRPTLLHDRKRCHKWMDSSTTTQAQLISFRRCPLCDSFCLHAEYFLRRARDGAWLDAQVHGGCHEKAVGSGGCGAGSRDGRRVS